MNYEELFGIAKIIFSKYTNTDISGINLNISNNKTKFVGMNAIASSRVEEDGSFTVCIYDLEGFNIFQCLLYLFHEFVHCLDIYNYCNLNGLEISSKAYEAEEFCLWTEFHAEKEAVKLFYRFMQENQGYSKEHIEKEFELYKQQKKEILHKKISEENIGFKFLYLFSQFYGRYFSFCELLEIEDKFPVDFIYDIRLADYVIFLYKHEDEVKTKEEWERLKNIIDNFYKI